MTAPTTRETADHFGEANEKVADHIGEATTMIDHAELARLAEAAENEAWNPDMWVAVAALNEFNQAANPATVLSLLSEIAALRGEKDRVGRVLTTMQEAIPAGHHPNGSGLRRFIADLKDRATQAERQRDELRKALEEIARATPTSTQSETAHDMAEWSHCRAVVALCAATSIADQGADQ